MRFCQKCQAETERHAGGGCRPCNNAYCAANRAVNLEKNRAYDVAYYAANVDKKRAYYAANRVAIRARKAANRAANRASSSASKAAYRAANPEATRASGRAIGAAYRARKRNAEGTHTASDVKQLLTLQKGKCACCQASIKAGYHVDHIMPLALKGRNDRNNLQLLCPTCNLSKGARHPVDFMQRRGFLL